MRRALGFTTVLAALCAAVIIGLIGGRVASYPERVTVSSDSYALTAAPDEWTGARDHLVAGGIAGGAAISYLKFDVELPEGAQPVRAWLWLGTVGGDLPGLIELSHVPDTGWEEKALTAANAPRLGQVIASVEPEPHAPAIAFDVTGVVTASGAYAFAITASSGTESARFVAREAGATTTPGGPTITLEWTDPSGSASPPPVAISPPDFTPTPRYTAPSSSPSPSPSVSPSVSPSPSRSVSPWPSASPSVTASASVSAGPSPTSSGSPSPGPTPPKECTVGPKLVPTCGTLWGVAPGAHTTIDRTLALAEFEKQVQKQQLIYHAYHRGDQIFPTKSEIAIARDPANPRILFLNWKPYVRWGRIARGDPGIDRYLDGLAEHLKANFPEQFFFSFHHEPENDVIDKPGSDMTAKDYAAAYRYTIKRLRAAGVTNAISTMTYMAYIPWNTKSWFADLYPGDDVVDWIAWDEYAYSDPGYGHGDFAEFMNRRSNNASDWPGFYNWAARTFPRKPLMLGEWGVWYSHKNPGHHAKFFDSARLQLDLFPRVKAYVYFETPDAGRGLDSRVHNTRDGLDSFRRLGKHPAFTVTLKNEDLSSPVRIGN